jgi:hypothetical protein
MGLWVVWVRRSLPAGNKGAAWGVLSEAGTGYGLKITFSRKVQKPSREMQYTLRRNMRTPKIPFAHVGSLSMASEIHSMKTHLSRKQTALLLLFCLTF